MKATKRDLVGRKIVAVDFRPFRTERAGAGAEKTTRPVLTLDNGRRVWFNVAETDVGDYGIEILITERGNGI